MELTPARMLVGLAGHEADVPLIRYAAMVTRLGPQSEERLPEIRFVHVQNKSRSALSDRFRLLIHEQVRKHFPLPMQVPVGCDLLRGGPVRRLAAFAADFDSDLLLVGQSLCPPPLCGRLTMAAPCPVWLVPPEWHPLIRRILVPVGLFDRDFDALRVAIVLARRLPRAKVLALHVHLEGAAVAEDEAYRQIQRRKQVELEMFLGGFDSGSVDVEPHLAVGVHIPDVIAAAAYRQSVDLVVMSTRGRSRLASLLLPSIAESTSRKSPASILVLKKSDRPLGFFGALAQKTCANDDIRFN